MYSAISLSSFTELDMSPCIWIKSLIGKTQHVQYVQANLTLAEKHSMHIIISEKRDVRFFFYYHTKIRHQLILEPVALQKW